MEHKTCEFCEKKFQTNNPRKKYCKASCKTRAYELRKGKEVPEFLSGNEYDIIVKEVKVKVENPNYETLKIQLEAVQQKYPELYKKKQKIQSKISELKNNPLASLAFLGGGGLGYLLGHKANNPFITFSAMFGVGLIGYKMAQPSEKTQKLEEIELRKLDKLLQEVDSLIKDNQLKEKFIKINIKNTPEHIEKIDFKEIKVPKRKGLVRKDKKNPPFITASELSDMHFDLYELTGRFGNFLGKIAKNTFITAYGKPGSGKSTFFVQMANFFTEHGMVIYITPEEGISPTFKQKLTNQNINSDNIHITAHKSLREIRKALKTYDYQFCFIDSINMLSDAKPEVLEKLRNDFPDVLFAIIMQSTKDGKFKGSNEYAHNSDINIHVDQGIASTIKNRFNELREYQIFEAYK